MCEQVGTASAPYLNRAVITLHGDRYKSIELPMVGAKCLAGMGCSQVVGVSVCTVHVGMNVCVGVCVSVCECVSGCE